MPKTKNESVPNLDLISLDNTSTIRRSHKIKDVSTPERTEKVKKYKVDLFGRLIPEANLKKLTYYNSLDEDTKKAVQPYLILRGLSGANYNRLQVMLLNEFVNPYIWEPIFYRHKDLLMKLLAACGSGDPRQRHSWIAYSQKKQPNIVLDVIKEYFNYSTMRAIEVLPLLDNTDIMNYAIALGRQTDELKKINERLSKNNKEDTG